MDPDYSVPTITSRETLVRLDVIVVGAGLGGLATAISIAQSGSRVTVFDAAKELQEIGAGLQLTPNCTKILQRWGLPDALWAAGAEPTELTVHRYTGPVLAQDASFARNMRTRYGAPFLDMHRVDLQRALCERARALGVRFRLGEKVVDLALDQAPRRPEVVTAAGARAAADLVVAADGLWSRCRSRFLGRDDPPRPTGDLAYRVVLKLDQIPDPDLRRRVAEPATHFWIGPYAHAVAYSLRGGTMYNIVLLVPDDLPPGVSRQEGSVEEMKALFEGWDPVLSRCLGLVDQVDKWKLMHRKFPERKWLRGSTTSPISSLCKVPVTAANVVSCKLCRSLTQNRGDACHPMLPYLAQGANSAIEDGAVLGLLLEHIQSRDQVPQALAMYEKLRKARGESIVRETFKQRDTFHMPDGPEQEARDEIFLSQLGKESKGPFPSRWTCPHVQPWLYGYDAYEEVEIAVKKEPFVKARRSDDTRQ
ncbi:FAD-dependent monooxygenase OpS4 [Apiospora marii]|uniref:FAD-dependent monooxygenase OpS4 n=1 Tax=Apiospora marii TaxID=335849 RepID=UPI00312F64DB